MVCLRVERPAWIDWADEEVKEGREINNYPSIDGDFFHQRYATMLPRVREVKPYDEDITPGVTEEAAFQVSAGKRIYLQPCIEEVEQRF
jgi:hypothetical protein